MIALSRTLALLGIVLCAVACKKPDESTAGANARSAAATATVTSGKLGLTAGPAPNAPKADKVGGHDGPLTSDSANDGVIAITIDGPVTALAVISVNAQGEPEGGQQWDTVVEDQPIPTGWRSNFGHGSETWQLGVEENGKLVNATSGSLSALGPGPHNLTLYVTDSGYFKTGHHLMVLAERPDHTVVKSNIFAM